MNYISLQQLQKMLTKKEFLYYCYILFGNNLFLLDDTQNIILKYLESFDTYERFVFSLDEKSSWNKIFELIHTKNLFIYKKKIFLLSISNKKIDNFIIKKLFLFISYLSKECLFLVRINTLTNTIKKVSHSYKNFELSTVLIECNTPQHNKLISWILQRAKNMRISLNKPACKLLCTYYEDDFNALNQTLYQLSIIYPEKNIDLIHVKNLINDQTSYFHILHLLCSILKCDRKRYLRILIKLQEENIIKPITILHNIQHIIVLLIICKRELLHKHHSIISLFNKYKISKNLHILFIESLKNINLKKLYSVITLLLQTEIILHKDHSHIIWNNLYLIILLLCNDIHHTNDTHKNVTISTIVRYPINKNIS